MALAQRKLEVTIPHQRGYGVMALVVAVFAAFCLLSLTTLLPRAAFSDFPISAERLKEALANSNEWLHQDGVALVPVLSDQVGRAFYLFKDDVHLALRQLKPWRTTIYRSRIKRSTGTGKPQELPAPYRCIVLGAPGQGHYLSAHCCNREETVLPIRATRNPNDVHVLAVDPSTLCPSNSRGDGRTAPETNGFGQPRTRTPGEGSEIATSTPSPQGPIQCRISNRRVFTIDSRQTAKLPNKCIYRLFHFCGSKELTILTNLMPCSGAPSMACITDVLLVFSNKRDFLGLEIKRNLLPNHPHTILVNGETANFNNSKNRFPIKTRTVRGNLKYVQSSGVIIAKLSSIGIRLRVSFSDLVHIAYEGNRQICGLCNLYNTTETGGIDLNENEKIDLHRDSCNDPCEKSIKERKVARRKCETIFSGCDAYVSRSVASIALENCTVAQCHMLVSGNDLGVVRERFNQSTCQETVSYAQQCREAGASLSLPSEGLCPAQLNCSNGTVYALHCQQLLTCSSPRRSGIQNDDSDCYGSCQCPEGTVWDSRASRCIPPDQCPCDYNGQLLLGGEAIPLSTDPSTACYCSLAQKVICKRFQRPIIAKRWIKGIKFNRSWGRAVAKPGEQCVELSVTIRSFPPITAQDGWRAGAKDPLPNGSVWRDVVVSGDTTTFKLVISRLSFGSRRLIFYSFGEGIRMHYNGRSYPLQSPPKVFFNFDKNTSMDSSSHLTVDSMQNQTSNPGDSLKIVCPVSSSPDAALVTWFKNGKLLQLDGDHLLQHKHCSNWLFINNAVPADSGIYRCVATSGPHAIASETTIKITDLWGPWSAWDACSVTCGEGFKQRRRKCLAIEHQEVLCPGRPVDYEICKRACKATCSSYQSQMYVTFDHLQYTFQGKCHYVLARDCHANHSPKWTIYQKTDFCDNGNDFDTERPYICTVGVELHVSTGRGQVIYLFSNGTVAHNSKIITNGFGKPFPYYEDGGITVRGNYSVMTASFRSATNLDLMPDVELLFHPLTHAIDVTVGPAYYNRTCGLCGIWNENARDDRNRLPGLSNQPETPVGFVSSWRTEECEHEIFNIPCSYDLALHQTASAVCNILGQVNGAFSTCGPVLQSQWDSLRTACQQRACTCLQSQNHNVESCLCEALQTAAEQCFREGRPPKQCSPGISSLRSNTSCMPSNCWRTVYSCSEEPVPCANISCQCDKDERYHQGRCIPIRMCPCRYNKRVYKRGEFISNQCRSCECAGADDINQRTPWQCGPVNCTQYGPPALLVAPKEIFVEGDQSAQLCCRGNQEGMFYSYQWYNSLFGMRLVQDARDGQLLLNSTALTIGGTFTCEAFSPSDRSRVTSNSAFVLKMPVENSIPKARKFVTCHRTPTEHQIKLPAGCYERQRHESLPAIDDDLLDQEQYPMPLGNNYINIGQCSLRPCALQRNDPPGADSILPRPGDSCSLKDGSSCQPVEDEVFLKPVLCRNSMEIYIPVSVACKCRPSSAVATEITGHFITGISSEAASLSMTGGRYGRKVPTAGRKFLLDAGDEDTESIAVTVSRGDRMPEFVTALPLSPGRRVLQNIKLPQTILSRAFQPEDGAVIHASSDLSLYIAPGEGVAKEAFIAATIEYLADDNTSASATPGVFLERERKGTFLFLQPIVVVAAKIFGVKQSNGLDLLHMQINFPLPASINKSQLKLYSLGVDARWEQQLTTVISGPFGPNRLHRATLPQVNGTWAIGFSENLCDVMVHVKETKLSSPLLEPVAGAVVTMERNGLLRATTTAVTDPWGVACVPAPCGVSVTVTVRVNGEPACSDSLRDGQCTRYKHELTTEQTYCSYEASNSPSSGSIIFTSVDRTSRDFSVWPSRNSLYSFQKNNNEKCFMTFMLVITQSKHARLITRAVSMRMNVGSGRASNESSLLLGWREVGILAANATPQIRCIEVACPRRTARNRGPDIRVLLQLTHINPVTNEEEDYRCKTRIVHSFWEEHGGPASTANSETTLLLNSANVKRGTGGVFQSNSEVGNDRRCSSTSQSFAAMLFC